MTTELPRLAIAVALGLALGAGAFACRTGRSGRRGGLPAAQVSKFPPKVQDAYRLFAVRCSRCHTLSRPLNASITEHAHWARYVARMRRQAGSGISEKDAEEILVFLDFWADRRSAAEAGRDGAATETATAGATP